MSSNEKGFYEKLSKQKLSEKEVLEARHNFVGFFDLLYRIDKKLRETSACSTSSLTKGKNSFKK